VKEQVLTMLTRVVLSSVLLVALAGSAHAAPLELENDVSVSWSQASVPCPPLCPFDLPVFGVPRLVPDASDVGDLLAIDIDIFGSQFVSFNLVLNVGDTSLNEILLPDGSPLRLTYQAFLPNFFVANPDGIIHFNDFENFALLPGGDLIFTLDGTFQGSSFATSPNTTAIITVSGPGTVIVPEPGSLVLTLSGLVSVCVFSRRRRLSQMRHANRRTE